MSEDRAHDPKRVPNLNDGKSQLERIEETLAANEKKSQIEKVFDVLSRRPDVTGN